MFFMKMNVTLPTAVSQIYFIMNSNISFSKILWLLPCGKKLEKRRWMRFYLDLVRIDDSDG